MSDKPKDGGSAFPETHVPATPDAEGWHGSSGMSLRDYFAGQALVGLLAGRREGFTSDRAEISDSSYKMADFMMKAKES